MADGCCSPRKAVYKPWAVYVSDADGPNQKKLIDSADGAVWSPDGQRIAYLALGEGRLTGVVVAQADGSNPQVLTQAGQYGSLAWSPDGEWIAFSHGRDNSSTIGQIRPDGTGKHTAQTGGLSAFDPAWRPSAPLSSDRRPCVVEGTHRADVLRGSDRGDLIAGRGGNDTIYGLGGDDVLVGGSGHDRLYGGRGRDLFGADDHRRDVVSGGTGFDSGYFDKRVDRLRSVELDQLTGRRP